MILLSVDIDWLKAVVMVPRSSASGSSCRALLTRRSLVKWTPLVPFARAPNRAARSLAAFERSWTRALTHQQRRAAQNDTEPLLL